MGSGGVCPELWKGEARFKAGLALRPGSPAEHTEAISLGVHMARVGEGTAQWPMSHAQLMMIDTGLPARAGQAPSGPTVAQCPCPPADTEAFLLELPTVPGELPRPPRPPASGAASGAHPGPGIFRVPEWYLSNTSPRLGVADQSKRVFF